MSRRRYLSTDISVDPKVTELARQHGDFAVLLYTWMIPHAGDDCSITADPDQIALMVVPGWRHRTADDIRAAVAGMVELGLLALDEDARKLCFPPTSFYRYQTYIKPANRRKAEAVSKPPQSGQTPAQNAEQQRETPQITASVKPSLPPSHSLSPSLPETGSGTREEPPCESEELASSRDAAKPAQLPAQRPKRVRSLVDLLTAQEIPLELTDRDERALLASTSPVELIAEAYAAAAGGSWAPGDDNWLRDNLSVHAVLSRLAGYQAWKRDPEGSERTSKRNGSASVPTRRGVQRVEL